MMEPAGRRTTDVLDCPECGGATGLVIVYGMPGNELMEAAEAGQVALGGCVIFAGQPDYRCSACDHTWSDDEDPELLW